MPSNLKELAERKRNLEMIDVLIDQYIPDKKKFVRDKIKNEQNKK